MQFGTNKNGNTEQPDTRQTKLNQEITKLIDLTNSQNTALSKIIGLFDPASEKSAMITGRVLKHEKGKVLFHFRNLFKRKKPKP